MQLKETQKVLDVFKQIVLNQSRAMLSKKGKNVSNDLYRSLDGVVKSMPNSISVEWTVMDGFGDCLKSPA